MPDVQSMFLFSLGTGAFTWVYYKMLRFEADELKSTLAIPIEDLPSELEGSSYPRKVFLEGIVECENPIQTQHDAEGPTNCVVYTLTEVAHFATKGLFGWSEDEKQTTSRQAVPFRLVSEGKSSSSGVSVRIPAVAECEANGMEGAMHVFSDVTKNHEFTFENFIEAMKNSGRMHKSSQFIESGVEVKSPLTIMGPVGIRKDGEIKMMGQPTVVSRRSRLDLIETLEDQARMWHYLFYGCALIAVGCCGYMGYRSFRAWMERRNTRRQLMLLRERKRREIEQKSVKRVEKTVSFRETKATDEKATDEEEDEKTLCVVCQERTANAVIMNCGHLYTCVSCTTRLSPRSCPICRQPIKRVVRVYKHDT